MVIGELAVALVAVGTKTVVSQLIQGAPVTRETWAEASRQIIDALVSHSSRQDAGFDRISGQIDRVSRQIDRVSRQIDDISMREFNEHMAAGRRHLRDLPVDWRTESDRRELTHDARIEFVRAFATAEQMKDAQRQALAEVAIGGCWLWAGSLRDAQGTFGKAREVLERTIIFGPRTPSLFNSSVTADDPSLIADYVNMLKLCKQYGERPATTALPETRNREASDGARIVVYALTDRWVECAGIELKIGQLQETTRQAPTTSPFLRLSAYLLPAEVRNTRFGSVWVSLTEQRYGSDRPTAAGMPNASTIAAKSAASLTLTGSGNVLNGMAVSVGIFSARPTINFLVPNPRWSGVISKKR